MPVKTKKKVAKNPKKTQSPLVKFRYFALRHKVLSGLILVALSLVLSVYLYQVVTSYQDERTSQQYKRQLDQIDKEMGVEFEKIVTELGKPISMTREKTCEYVSADLDPGNPSCGPVYYVLYNFDDLHKSTSFMEESTAVINRNTHLDLKDTSYLDSNNPIYVRKSINSTYDKSDLVRCSLDIRRTPDMDDSRTVHVSVLYRCSQVSPKAIYREVNK